MHWLLLLVGKVCFFFALNGRERDDDDDEKQSCFQGVCLLARCLMP